MSAKATKGKGKEPNRQEIVTISPPDFRYIRLHLVGRAPLATASFSARQQAQIRSDQESGRQKTSRKTREKKDFERDFEEATYTSEEGWHGINASAFRNAAISACRAAGYKMTHAKLALHIEADGVSADDQKVPLVQIHGEREMWVARTRNATGVMDLRARPRWPEWKMTVTIRFDNSMFSARDVVNLMTRVGLQVGIGEGRPDSRASAGLGMGLFDIVNEETGEVVA